MRARYRPSDVIYEGHWGHGQAWVAKPPQNRAPQFVITTRQSSVSPPSRKRSLRDHVQSTYHHVTDSNIKPTTAIYEPDSHSSTSPADLIDLRDLGDLSSKSTLNTNYLKYKKEQSTRPCVKRPPAAKSCINQTSILFKRNWVRDFLKLSLSEW